LSPYNALGFLGLHIISMGNSAATGDEYDILKEIDPVTRIYRKLVIKDKHLVGALFLNKLDRAGLYRRLLEEGTDVTPLQDELLQPHFGLLSLPEEVWQQWLVE